MQKTKIQVGTVYAVRESKYSTPIPVLILDKDAEFPKHSRYSGQVVGTEPGIKAQHLDPKDVTARPVEGKAKTLWSAGVGDTFKVESRQVIQTWEAQAAEDRSIAEREQATARRDAAESARLRGVTARIANLLGDSAEKYRQITDREPYKGYRDFQPRVNYDLEADTLLALVEAAHQAGFAAAREAARG